MVNPFILWMEMVITSENCGLFFFENYPPVDNSNSSIELEKHKHLAVSI